MKNAIAKQQQINQELSVLIDEDLQQEQELLKALIEEILNANEKIKKAHFERVEDTEAKLKVLNAEVQRIRKTISAQDDTVTEKRLKLLNETKVDYFEALGELRLKDVKSHFSEPLRKHLKDISQRLESHLDDKASTKNLNQSLLTYYKALENEIEKDGNLSVEAAHSQGLLFEDIRTTSTPLLDELILFLTPINESLKNHLKNHLTTLDTSEIDELFDDILSVKNDDLSDLNDQKNALNEALKNDLNQLDQSFDDDLAEALDTALGSNKDELLTDDVKAQIEAINALQDEIHTVMVSGSNAEDLKKKFKSKLLKLYQTPYGKILKKVHKSFKKESKRLVEAKKQKRKEHLEQLYEVLLQEKERSIQAFIDVSSLKLRTLHDKTAALEPLFVNVYSDLKNIFELTFNLIKANYDLELTLFEKKAEVNYFIDQIIERKIAFSRRYETLVKALKIKTLDVLEAKHIHFEKTYLSLETQLEKERLELNRLYGLDKILNARLRVISKSKISRLNEVELLKYQLYQDESDISLAEKEYDIQVLKAQSLYDHERAINKVQTERVDAGVRVNKAMVQATVKRQVNFADQQIKFAEAEYAARLEHIEYTLNQELEYTEETLGLHYQAFEKRRQEMELEYLSKKHSNEQKKKLFKHSQMLNKVLNEEKEIDLDYQKKQALFEEDSANTIQIKRYLDQIKKANEHAENARIDALELKNKDIASFQALRQESLDRLANIESMMTEPDLLPYHQESVNDQASIRLQEMLDSAETFLNEKISGPKASLEETKERLIELEKQTLSSEEIQRLTNQEVRLNESFELEIKNLDLALENKLTKLDEKQTQILSDSQTVLDHITPWMEENYSSDTKRLERLNQAMTQSLKTLRKNNEERLLGAKLIKDDFINKINRTLSNTLDSLNDHRVKTQMVLEKVEHRQSSSVNEVYNSLKKAFKKKVNKIK
jgi:ribonuclease HI